MATMDFLRQYTENFILTCFLWWSILCNISNLIFNDARRDSSSRIIDKTINSYRAWTSKNSKNPCAKKVSPGTSRSSKWWPPPMNTLKIKSDGSTKYNGTCRVAFIIRNNTGFSIFFHSERSFSSSHFLLCKPRPLLFSKIFVWCWTVVRRGLLLKSTT